MLSSAGKPRNKPAKDGEIIAPTLLAMAVTPAAGERPPGTTTVVYNCQSGAAIYETPERSSSAAVVSGRTVPFSCSHKLAHPTGAYSKPPATQPPPVLQPDPQAAVRSAARPGHRRRNHPVPAGAWHARSRGSWAATRDCHPQSGCISMAVTGALSNGLWPARCKSSYPAQPR